MAYAVACAMEIAESLFPEELAGKGVELAAACAFGIDGLRQGYVAFHHQGEVVALFGGGGAHGYGAGYVGGAVEVLCA